MLAGSTFSYTALLQGLTDEICLVDVRVDKARGEAMDLSHAAPFAESASIWAGTMDALSEKRSMVPPSRVLGSGTARDTAPPRQSQDPAGHKRPRRLQ